MIFASERELKLPYTFQWDTIQEAAWVFITSNILLSDFQCANPPCPHYLLHLGDRIAVDDIHVGLCDLDQRRHNDFRLLSGKP